MHDLTARLTEYLDLASDPPCLWVVSDAPDADSLAMLRARGYLVYVCRTVEECCAARTEVLLNAAQMVASGQYARLEAERGYPIESAPARLAVVLDRVAHQRARDGFPHYRECFLLNKQYVDVLRPGEESPAEAAAQRAR